METILYQEKQVQRLRDLTNGLPVLATAYSCFADHPSMMSIIVAFLIAALISAVVLGFTTLNIVVTTTHLCFGFPFWRKSIPLDEIDVGQVEKIPLMAATGLHYWNRQWVYSIHRGSGLALFVNRSKYLIGTGEPEKLQRILRQTVTREQT